MSINLVLDIVDSLGNRRSIDLIQTPTEITFNAVNSNNPGEVYLEWLDSRPWDPETIAIEKKTIRDLMDDPNITLEWTYI